MGLGWVFMIRGDAVWIVLAYWLDRIVSSSGSYRIGWIGSYRIISAGSEHWLLCAGWLLPGWDGWDGWTGGALVGRGWDGPTLAPARTGAPPWAPEQERHRWLLRGGRLWEVLAGTNYVGAARTRSICVGEAK